MTTITPTVSAVTYTTDEAIYVLAGCTACLIGGYIGQRLHTWAAARTSRRRRDYLDTPPPSDGVLLSGQAGREALGATLRQLQAEPDAPTLCWMSGQRVNRVGLIKCPAHGCHRPYVDVDANGVVEPHWTKPAAALPKQEADAPW